jgi:hypothetical protein
MRVEQGQLRRWSPEVEVLGESAGGSMFLVLEQHPAFTNDPFWRVLRPVGDTKLWSESRIEGWSEVVGEAG